jgi:hypothetical protein
MNSYILHIHLLHSCYTDGYDVCVVSNLLYQLLLKKKESVIYLKYIMSTVWYECDTKMWSVTYLLLYLHWCRLVCSWLYGEVWVEEKKPLGGWVDLRFWRYSRVCLIRVSIAWWLLEREMLWEANIKFAWWFNLPLAQVDCN